MERQKIIIDELKDKFQLPFDNLNKLSNDDLKKAIDNAVLQVLNQVQARDSHSMSWFDFVYLDRESSQDQRAISLSIEDSNSWLGAIH